MDYIKTYEQDIIKGGTKYDKLDAIKKWTYKRFCEAPQNQTPVTIRNLQEWALQAAMQYQSEKFHFQASATWTKEFKRNFKIRQRKVTRFIKSTEKKSPEEILINAKTFQNECLEKIASMDLNYVFNTDQKGCEYHTDFKQTLDHRGIKSVEVFLGDANKVTHSYTVQYTVTASGKLLPKVFLCLQEAKGDFGPLVKKRVDALVAQYKNVVVTASKSGKLTSSIFDTYTREVLVPFVKDNKFTLILDSWGGQKDQDLYAKFNGSCNLIVRQSCCTQYYQPLDVYFHRQAKILIKELQNCTYLIEQGRQLNTREDAIRIQSIVHFLLSAPLFKEMIEYAWYASKLITCRDEFMNVSQICFPERPCKSNCSCNNRGFIKCSWCKIYFCFGCFYDVLS